MERKDMFDEMTAAILKAAQHMVPTKTKRMTREGLMAHALAELQKAAREPTANAMRRMAALKQSVEVAKLSFEDTESESVQVPIFVEATTAFAELTETEIPLDSSDADTSSAAFAENPEDLTKALADLQRQLDDLGVVTAPVVASASKNTEAQWPLDMNTRDARGNVRKRDGVTWGADPDFENTSSVAK